MDIFCSHHKTGLVLRVIYMHFIIFSLRSRYRIFFVVARISNIFWGMPDIPDLLGERASRCWVQVYVLRKDESAPLPTHPNGNTTVSYHNTLFLCRLLLSD